MKRTILAVEGGGSGFRRALVRGTEISELAKSGPLRSLTDLLSFVAAGLSAEVAGIAYATAGVIERHDLVVVSPNLHFLDGIVLATRTKAELGKLAIVCNDMEAAVSGMDVLFPGLPYFAGITMSSGVGLRIVKNGEIVSDSEGGHAQIDDSPYAPLCGCFKRGCAEAIFGGLALQDRVRAETRVRGIDIPMGFDPNAFLDEEFDAKEEWAIDIYDLLAHAIARFLANLQTTSFLPAVIWKGGLGKQVLPRAEAKIRANMRKMLMKPALEEMMKFHFCWDVEPVKDADSLLGAASIMNMVLA